MKVTVHRLYDQLIKYDNRIFGLNEQGDQKIKKFIADHQEWRGGERLEHGKTKEEIKFIWDMTEEEFKLLMSEDTEEYEEPTYCGAVFFGNFKLEFMKKNYGGCTGYRNLFQYGAEDTKGEAYDYLEDGTPYEERYPISDEIRIPHRRTFDSFAGNVEQQVIDLLNNHPEFIKEALKSTIPSNWYPGERLNYIKNFTREN